MKFLNTLQNNAGKSVELEDHIHTKAEAGLSNVDNTSDLLKPISTATQTALDGKLNSGSYTASDVLSKLLTVDGTGTGLDADKVDGYDFNQSLKTTDSPTFANVYAPSLENFRINSSLSNKVIASDTSQIAQSPISPFLWHDLFAFNKVDTPTFETSVDGSVWVSGTLDSNLFSQKENQVITVLNSSTTKSVRWTWNSNSFAWSSGAWLLLAFTYVATACNKNVVFESSTDGTNWTVRHTSTNTLNAQPAWFYVDNYAGATYLRLTLTHNSGGNINMSSIRLLTARWGDQGMGSELSYPYSWDANQNMTILGSSLKVGSNTVYHQGNDGTGSGLDADLLDGKHASDLALVSHSHLAEDLPKSGGLSRNTLTGTTTTSDWFQIAETPINTLDYDCTLKIVITSTANANIRQTIIAHINGESFGRPSIFAENAQVSASSSNNGIRYIRVSYPKTLNNGYKTLIEINTYDTVSRNIKVELLETKNVSLCSSLAVTTYNSTYHNTTQIGDLWNDLNFFNKSLACNISGTSSQSYYTYNDNYVAGESMIANDILYLASDSKWYKVNVNGRVIPNGSLYCRCNGTLVSGNTVGAYISGRFTLPTGLGTITTGKDIYVQGNIVNNVFTSTGLVTTELVNGFSYIRLGVALSSTLIYYDTNHDMVTLNSDGNLTSFNNFPLPAPSSSGSSVTISSTSPAGLTAGGIWYEIL